MLTQKYRLVMICKMLFHPRAPFKLYQAETLPSQFQLPLCLFGPLVDFSTFYRVVSLV